MKYEQMHYPAASAMSHLAESMGIFFGFLHAKSVEFFIDQLVKMY